MKPNRIITFMTPKTNTNDILICCKKLIENPLIHVLNRDNIASTHYIIDSFDIQTKLSLNALIQLCVTITQSFCVDFYVRNNQNISYKVFIADMDKTLIMQECIDELGKITHAGKIIENITERAMRGEIDFTHALQERVHLLKGITIKELHEVRKTITIRKHMPLLLSALKKRGIYTALISGGFHFFAEHFASELGFDTSFSNRLEIKNDTLTGYINGTIIDGQFKRDMLLHFRDIYCKNSHEIIAMGDGANDVPMLTEAGIAISMQGKDILKPLCNLQLSHCHADILLTLL